MATTSRDVTLPVPPNDAYMLARGSGCEIPSFGMSYEQAPVRIGFHRGFGWSNPIDVTVTVWQSGPTHSTLRYEASIFALADPFGFMDKNLDRFVQHLQAHHHAWRTGTRPPPAPSDGHSMKVNLILIGAIFGVMIVMSIVMFAALARH